MEALTSKAAKLQEQSDQYAFNFQVNCEQWSGLEGFLKFGIYREDVERTFDQDTFAIGSKTGVSAACRF